MNSSALLIRSTGLALAIAVLSACSSNAGIGSSSALPGAGATAVIPDSPTAYSTAYRYVTYFYPQWMFYNQAKLGGNNVMTGPETMSPVYHVVVAPNDDTLYGEVILNVSQEPTVVTIPSTTATFSVLSLDFFGNVLTTGISSSGVYGFVGPNYTKSLPKGVTKIQLPTNYSPLIIRADRYSSTGVDQNSEAAAFRGSLMASPLSTWKTNKQSGQITLYPVAYFSVPIKTIADGLITADPQKYLTGLQKAVNSGEGPPLNKGAQQLAARFDNYFSSWSTYGPALSAGARAAHAAILSYYLSNAGPTHWIHFPNVGNWSGAIMRSAIQEYIQCANGSSTAAYYQTFSDAKGVALDATKHGYKLTFSASEIPVAKRFWSVTAYVPQSITLVKNPAKKYLVASYTPHLRKGKNGSISIYMSPTRPKGVPPANWLPVPKGPFNLMLRVYGPQGSVANNTYVPPAVTILP